MEFENNIHQILDKKKINKLYEMRYKDVQERGKYTVVYYKGFINFLHNTAIEFNDKYNYVAPVGVDLINIPVNIFKNILYSLYNG